MTDVQFIHGVDGEAMFAVLPIQAYRALMSGQAMSVGSSKSLLNEDETMIKLPYGGPNAMLSVPALLDYLREHEISHLAINQRAQAYDKYPENQHMTLDPIIRRLFLDGSPYKDTMQAVAEVVDALVATGHFKRTKRRYEGIFSRAVNALDVKA